MDEIETRRVLILGAGIGALYAALALAPRPVTLITPGTLGEGASSHWAQGGIAAAMDPADSPADHVADTVRAGAGLTDPAVAAEITGEARRHVEALAAMGVPFDRTDAGGYAMSREAAHGRARVVRVGGDGSGAAIMATLIARVRDAPSIQVLDGVRAVGLVTRGGRVDGALLERAAGSAPVAIHAPAVLLAAGGVGGLYAVTSNPPHVAGQALGMAARAGAEILDAEFVQFHPTALDVAEDPAPLATEALRGAGAVLIDETGRRVMPAHHPEADLAPRDVVARAVFAEARAGRRPCLDCRSAIGPRIGDLFPALATACARHGIDPARSPVPVAPAAHYHMGGVATDGAGRSSLPGLWVCGEAAATGLHGANRLASNGLLEALVTGGRCAADIAARVPQLTAPSLLPRFARRAPQADPVAELRDLMTRHVGVERDRDGLRTALDGVDALDRTAGGPAFRASCAAARMIATAALRREESRGAHFRRDFPQTHTDATHSRLTLADTRAAREET